MSPVDNPEIAVVGGGVAGLGPAWQLASRGYAVHLFERDHIGGGASSRAAGMLAPTSEVTFEEQRLLEFGQHSLGMYPQFIDDLHRVCDVDLGVRRQGALIVAVDRDDAEALEHLHRYHRRLELPVERLVGKQARDREPGLAPRINYALYTPHDHQLDPRRLVEALGEAFTAAGGVLHEQTPVRAVDVTGDQLRGLVLEDGERIDVSRVIVATGAWTGALDGLPQESIPHIRPVRGQMIALELGDPPLIEHVIRAPDAYLVPKTDGRLLIGSTMEERGLDPRPTAGGLFEILEGAREAVPGIHEAQLLDIWTGFRPMTLANEPVVGPTDVEGLYLSVGHGRNGILLTPATAYGLAECIDTGAAPDYLAPFVPDTASHTTDQP